MRKQPLYSAIISSPLGKIGLLLTHGKVSEVSFLPESAAEMIPDDNNVKLVTAQLAKYFANPRYQFSLALDACGSVFQRRVWQALCEVPSGETWTYGQLAKKLQTSPRAVGQACRSNPLPIIVPCHRIVAAHDLGGYAGKTDGKLMDVKKWLLRHEGAIKG